MTIDVCRCGEILPSVEDTETPFEFCSKKCKLNAEFDQRMIDICEKDKTHTKNQSG